MTVTELKARPMPRVSRHDEERDAVFRFVTARFEDDDIAQSFEQLARSVTDAERARWRNRIIIACIPLADHIAFRFAGRGEPSDDLVQVARIGLIKTVDRFRAAEGRFLAFAVPTIMGEVRRHFRDSTWMVRVPRAIQESHVQARDAIDELSQRLSRTPTAAELAGELDVDPESVAHVCVVSSAYSPLSLNAPLSAVDGAGADTLADVCGAEDYCYTAAEDHMVLRDVLAELDGRRRDILGMSFLEELTQRQIARRLGVSQAQVCRLLNDALTRLRQRLCVDVPAA